jgi:hypothetical protein
MQFRFVRVVEEGPEHVVSQGYDQFRRLEVYDLDDSVASEAFVAALDEYSRSSPDLIWTTADRMKRGRDGKRNVIASHSPYLFGKERFREGEPLPTD